MRIEEIKVKNFKALRNIHIKNVPNFCVVVGANGSGKSSLFDLFGFLKDCFVYNVKRALEGRGGYKEVCSRHAGDEVNEIELEIKFRMEITGYNRLVTYLLQIKMEGNEPIISREILRYKRGQHGYPYHFLDFSNGIGYAVTNEEDFAKPDTDLDREEQSLGKSVLAIKGLGQFKRFKAANAFCQLIENWHVSDFHINLARGIKDAVGEYEHLSVTGDNLQRVAEYMYNNHPDKFKSIINTMKNRVPGIENIETVQTQDGRLILNFQYEEFKSPFIDRYVSDGTIKMLAYLVLLNDPCPHPLLCVEEPENQLYPTLLAELAEEFRLYANKGGQVFVSTHSPDLLNAVELDEVFWLAKGQDGYTKIKRANEDQQIVAYMKQGDKMGWLWREGFFPGANP